MHRIQELESPIAVSSLTPAQAGLCDEEIVMKPMYQPLVLMVSVLLLFSAVAIGQAVYGNIIGTVTDASGAGIGNAAVTINDLDRGETYKTTANASGNYEQTHLLAGHYKVTISAAGFNNF